MWWTPPNFARHTGDTRRHTPNLPGPRAWLGPAPISGLPARTQLKSASQLFSYHKGSYHKGNTRQGRYLFQKEDKMRSGHGVGPGLKIYSLLWLHKLKTVLELTPLVLLFRFG